MLHVNDHGKNATSIASKELTGNKDPGSSNYTWFFELKVLPLPVPNVCV